MRKLNLDQLEDQFEVIHSNQLYCIKGGYGTTSSGGYGNGYYDPFSDGYDIAVSGAGGGTTPWSEVVQAALAGTLAAGTYTNIDDDSYSYTAPGADNSSDPGLSGSYGGYGSPGSDVIGGVGGGDDCVFQCIAYANSKFGGNAAYTASYYQSFYDAEYGSGVDGVSSSNVVAFANAVGLTTFNCYLSDLTMNAAVPANEVIMTDVNQGDGTSHEEILMGIYSSVQNPTSVTQISALLLDPQNGNAINVVPVTQINYTNLIGYTNAPN